MMKKFVAEILLRNICRWEILEYLDRLGFVLDGPGGAYHRGEIKLKLSETCKDKLCSIQIDETSIELEGPEDQVLILKEEIWFHFLRAGG